MQLIQPITGQLVMFVRIMIANLRTFGRIICTTFAAVRPYNASHSEYCVIWNSLQFCTTMNEFMIQTYSICIEIQHSMYVTQRCRPNQYWEWLQYWNHVRTYLNQAKLSHWLDVAEQVRYKLSMLMYWCQYNQASLSDLPLHASFLPAPSFGQQSSSLYMPPAGPDPECSAVSEDISFLQYVYSYG